MKLRRGVRSDFRHARQSVRFVEAEERVSENFGSLGR
jgi:hypothetical protein